MKKIKPKFAYNEEGKKIGVLLSIRDFDIVVEELEELDDYKCIKEYDNKKGVEKMFSPEKVMAEIMRKR